MLKSRTFIYVLFIPILIFMALFLIVPIGTIFMESIKNGDMFTIGNYLQAISDKAIQTAMVHSMHVSLVAASVTTSIAFLLAYAIHMTKMPNLLKKVVRVGGVLPMLLPTITYGFILMYVFGNQGILAQLFGAAPFSIYGFNGLVIGYILYTLPAAFMLILNGFQYVDQRYVLVSYLMGDSAVRRFYHATLRPLLSPIGGAFVLSFVLSFTDFGIPASIGGEYQVIATTLYQTMLGAIPNIEQGAVIAILMLIPAVIGVVLLSYLDKLQHTSEQSNTDGVLENRFRDICFSIFSSVTVLTVFCLFLFMLCIPFTVAYPYDLHFTMEHLKEALAGNELTAVFKTSLLVAVCTAIIGTMIAFLAALIQTRTTVTFKKSINWIAMITNTVPGMVLGLSYLLLFSGSSLKGTLAIIIISNIVHFFTTPYLMAKNALAKMDRSWEVTGELLKDSWFRTVIKVILPNMKKTIVEMISFYFINAMVTISGVIFLVTTTTGLMATKINELQHFNKFNEIFILSIFIFLTNLGMKLVSDYYVHRKSKPKKKQTRLKEVA